MVAAILAFLTSEFGLWLLGILGGAGILFGTHLKGKSDGKALERAKQAGRDRKAMEERHEMSRDATDIEKRAAGMSDDELNKVITR